MTTPHFAFICRGSSEEGLGHVMRSRAVADASVAQAASALFAIGDDAVEPLLRSCCCEVQCFADDQTAITQALAHAPDAIFLDTTHLASSLFRQLKQAAPIISLSPVFDQLHAADLFFHRTVHHPGPSQSGWHCGLEYAVIRPECLQNAPIIARRIPPAPACEQEPLSIAISMGGGDASNKTLRLLQRLKDIEQPLLVWALLGAGYEHSYDELVQCIKDAQQHEIVLARTTKSMWRVMSLCSVAVLAGGTVTYEAIAAGLPAINIFDNPDQAYLVRELIERGAAIDAGGPFDTGLDRTITMLGDLAVDQAPLHRIRAATRNLIDGCGAQRIVHRVMSHLGHTVGAAA